MQYEKYKLEEVLQELFNQDIEFIGERDNKTAHQILLKSGSIININKKGKLWIQGTADKELSEIFPTYLEEVKPVKENKEVDKSVKSTHKMKFGKYQGWEIGKIPGDYLAWIYKNIRLKQDLKEYIKENVSGLT